MDERSDSAVGFRPKLGRRLSKIQRSGNESIGIMLGSTDDHHVVTQIDESGPAFRNGVRIGDQINTINEVDVTSMEHAEVIKMITTGGSSLTFGLDRDGVEQQTGAATSTQNKNSEPLGITVVSGGAFNNQSGVTRVDPNSPGERAGLKVGDILMSVNGVSVEKMEHADVLALLSDSNTEELAIGVKRGQDEVKASTSTALVLDLGMVVERTSEGFIQVVEVFVNGAAEQAGVIAGDLLLETQGVNLIKIKFKKAVELLRAESEDGLASLVTCNQPVVKQVIRGFQSRKPLTTTPTFYNVMVQRATQGSALEPLGMGIVTDTSGPKSHIVSTVIDGGCADRSGIRVNDKLVQINGEVVVQHNHERVLDMLKQTGLTFTLGIERDATLPGPPTASRVNAPRTVLETKSFTEVEI